MRRCIENLNTGEKCNICKYDLIYIGIIMFTSISIYLLAIKNGFVLDDKIQIIENPLIKDFRNIPKIFTSGILSYMNSGAGSNYYRPIMNIIYMMDYYLFGLKPWGFHFINILIHSATSILVFIFLKQFLKKATQQRASFPAFVAALLFATHPIHTEAVVWVAAVPELSYTLFFLLALYFYMRGREGTEIAYRLSWASFALAMLCKEPAVTLIIALIAYDYLFKPQGERLSDYLKRYLPYLLIFACYLGLRFYALDGFAPRQPNIQLSGFAYVINIFPLFCLYLGKLLLPVNLNALYVFHPIFSLLATKGIISVVITLGFIVLTCAGFKKRSPSVFSLLLIVIPLLPPLVFYRSLGIFAFGERYLYLPTFGFVMLLAFILSWAQVEKRKIFYFACMITLVISSLYSFETINRNAAWQNEFSLYTDIERKAPDSFYAHDYLGLADAKQGHIGEAIKELQTAVALKPDFADGYYNLGLIYMGQRKKNAAIWEYKQALKVNPKFVPAREMLNLLLTM